MPLTRTSKCTCGPKQWPVQPTVPITWPCLTLWPDADADRGLVPVAGGDPAAVLDAGVVAVAADPAGDRDACRRPPRGSACRSARRCRRRRAGGPSACRSGDTTGPFTGQMKPPLPCRIGPAGSGAAPPSCAVTCAEAASSAATSPSSSCRCPARPASDAALAGRARRRASPWRSWMPARVCGELALLAPRSSSTAACGLLLERQPAAPACARTRCFSSRTRSTIAESCSPIRLR